MGVRAVQVQLDNKQAPVSGWAVYLVIEETNKRVQLLHPWTLSSFSIPLLEFQKGEGATYWPAELSNAPQGQKEFEMSKVLARMEYLLEDYASRTPPKQHPAQVVRRVIAEIKGVPLEDIPQFKEAKAPTAAARESVQRRPGVIDAIKESLDKGATIEKMVALLKERFPERDADGMRNTVKCQLARLPKNTNRPIVKTGEGKDVVYKWGAK